jgi:hypothetical protein
VRRLSVLAAAFFVFAAFTSLLTMGAAGQALTPSDPVITSGPADPTNSQDATFAFTGDPLVTFRCKLDDGSFADCESPKTYSGPELTEGPHTFSVKASDGLGNESGITSYDWTIDLTDPTTWITVKPPNPDDDATPTFSFTSDEAGSSFECKLDDDASFTPCPSPQEYKSLAAGSHTFSVKATDLAGNTDGSPATYTWTIDLTDPTTSITAQPLAMSNDDSPSFSFTSSEADSSFACALDGGALSSCPSPKSYFSLPDGSHTFVVSATDPAGNTDATPESYTWAIDTSAPVVTLSSPADGSATSDVTPAISGLADTGPADSSTVAVALYQGTTATESPLQTWSSVPVDQATGSWSVVAPSLTEATYTVGATQSDSLGRSGSATHTFRVDLSAPAVTLTSPSHGLITNNSTLSFAGSAGTAAGDHTQVTLVISQGTTNVMTVPDVPVVSGSWSWSPTEPLDDGTYTVHAEQSDDAGETGTSNVNSFTLDTVLPSALSGTTVVNGYGFVSLRWTRGADWQPEDALVIRRRVAGSADSIRRYRGTGTSFKDARVKNGVSYVYELFAVDRAGNRSSTLSRRARPSGFRAPRNGSMVSTPPEIKWVDVANSTYSNIQVWNARVTVKMLSVWPNGTRYALRSRWTFAGHVYRLRHGRKYRVYGWPGFGPKSASRYGKSYGWVSFIYR